jgi:hypothetical protein
MAFEDRWEDPGMGGELLGFLHGPQTPGEHFQDPTTESPLEPSVRSFAWPRRGWRFTQITWKVRGSDGAQSSGI